MSLARLLAQAGAEVDVVMTHSAREFVGAVTFEGVTGRRVHTDLFESGEALAHIRLARAADLVVVAPATADFLARAATGRGDDLLTTMLLAATCPVLIAPAMNDRMWAHPQVRANVAHLRDAVGYTVVDPDTGPLAVGEGEGPGRLPEPEALVLHVSRALAPPSTLAGRTIIVSAGATREPLDPVRFLSNYSTGRMGIAIARAAWLRGADVTLVAGATEVEPPAGVDVVRVGSAQDMATAMERLLPAADALIMAAAPADFRPARIAPGKIKKWNSPRELELTETPDILLSTIPHRRARMVVVGFALETENLVQHARVKLQHKQLDLVVANRAGTAGEGFGSDTNRVTFVTATGADELPVLPKDDVAEAILDRVEKLLDGR